MENITCEIVLTCPNCGNSTWYYKEDEEEAFECAACGDIVFPEDMCSVVKEV